MRIAFSVGRDELQELLEGRDLHGDYYGIAAEKLPNKSPDLATV